MFIVYVLKSLKNGKRYVGFTSKDINVRLSWHHKGLTQWTKQNGPFELILEEKFTERKPAIQREKYLKSGQGRRTIEHLIKKSSVFAAKRGESAKNFGGG